MSNAPVHVHPEVEADLRAAMAHYQSWRSDGAEQIRRKYLHAIERITAYPKSFHKKHGPFRRAVLSQSYYIIYFLEEIDRTIVVAVLDGRRDPREIEKAFIRRSRT